MRGVFVSLFTLTALALLMIAAPVQAQAINPLAIICRVINVIWTIFWGIAILMFIWAGILYLTARGEPAKVQSVNKMVIWGTVGVAVGILAFSAYSLVSFLIFNTGANFACPP